MRLFIVFLAALLAFAADDLWTKLSDIKTGSDLRVYRTGNKPPILATFADVNEDNLIVLVKNTETAIPKDQIERIDARGKQGKPAMTTETHTSEEPPAVGAPNMHQQEGLSSNSSSSVSFGGGKGDFQTVYRRNLADSKTPAK